MYMVRSAARVLAGDGCSISNALLWCQQSCTPYGVLLATAASMKDFCMLPMSRGHGGLSVCLSCHQSLVVVTCCLATLLSQCRIVKTPQSLDHSSDARDESVTT
jgi:hypothetical protein